jgi:hypothetical protein
LKRLLQGLNQSANHLDNRISFLLASRPALPPRMRSGRATLWSAAASAAAFSSTFTNKAKIYFALKQNSEKAPTYF